MVTFSNSSAYRDKFTFLRDYLRSTYPELDAHVVVEGPNYIESEIIISSRSCDSVHASCARQHAESAIRVLRGNYRKATFINAC